MVWALIPMGFLGTSNVLAWISIEFLRISNVLASMSIEFRGISKVWALMSIEFLWISDLAHVCSWPLGARGFLSSPVLANFVLMGIEGKSIFGQALSFELLCSWTLRAGGLLAKPWPSSLCAHGH